MTNELKCLHEKLGTGMFQVSVLTEFDPRLQAPELNPEILEVEFDKCDPCKVTFTVYVELPRVPLVAPEVNFDGDTNPDVKVLPVEHRISTSGHLHPLEMNVFMVHPLAEDNAPEPQDGVGAVSSAGFEDECYSYEQCRVPCKNGQSWSARECMCLPLSAPDSFRVTFPLSREVACLIPEFGLSGFYLKNLVSANLKTKVRLVSGNNPNATIVAGLLSYDPERCEACLEVCEDQSVYQCITEGYEYLFSKDDQGNLLPQPSLSEMATNRRYNVRGVSKCTEKDLFSFEICFKPSLVELDSANQNYMNYGIVALSTDHWCYQFENKTPELNP
jgi:hypothetical protein